MSAAGRYDARQTALNPRLVPEFIRADVEALLRAAVDAIEHPYDAEDDD